MYLNTKHLFIGSVIICASVMLYAFDDEQLQEPPSNVIEIDGYGEFEVDSKFFTLSPDKQNEVVEEIIEAQKQRIMTREEKVRRLEEIKSMPAGKKKNLAIKELRKHLYLKLEPFDPSVVLTSRDVDLINPAEYLRQKEQPNKLNSTELDIFKLAEENKKLKAEIFNIKQSISRIEEQKLDRTQFKNSMNSVMEWCSSAANHLVKQNLTIPQKFNAMLQSSSPQISLIIINELRGNPQLRWEVEKLINKKIELLPQQIGYEIDQSLHYDRVMRNK